jgi:hypothetical protein
MGSLLKTSIVAVVVGFLLLLPALVYGDRYVLLDLFQDKNCTEGNGIPGFSTSYDDISQTPNATFNASNFNESYTFESAILTNYTGDVNYLIACQAGLLCNDDTTAFKISFNLGDIGACSTAGPQGTKFDKFLLSS